MIRQQPVQKGVVIPEPWFSRYPIKQMEVGDSFVHIDKDAVSMRSFWDRINGLVYSYGKRYGFKMRIRKVSDKSARVWRVE